MQCQPLAKTAAELAVRLSNSAAGETACWPVRDALPLIKLDLGRHRRIARCP